MKSLPRFAFVASMLFIGGYLILSQSVLATVSVNNNCCYPASKYWENADQLHGCTQVWDPILQEYVQCNTYSYLDQNNEPVGVCTGYDEEVWNNDDCYEVSAAISGMHCQMGLPVPWQAHYGNYDCSPPGCVCQVEMASGTIPKEHTPCIDNSSPCQDWYF